MFREQCVCLAIFDEEEGPTCVYAKGIDKEVADKIAVKSMVGAMTFNQQGDDGESIIPLQEEQRSIFVFNFAIPDEKARGGVIIGTLNFIVKKEDINMIYRLAPMLSEHSKRIVQDIKKYYVYRQPIPPVLMDSVDSILSVPKVERASLPIIFKEYLIQIYLSRNTTFHRSIAEKTTSISRNEEILGDKIEIVGRDKDQNIVWVLLSCNFSKMSNEEKMKLYAFLDNLGKDIPSLEVIFVLNELGLGRDGAFDENMMGNVTRISRTSEDERKKFDLCGMDANENIVWALLSKNFLAMEESEIDELNKKIYQLKRAKPSMEAFFTLAEILKTTKLQTPIADFVEKPIGLKKMRKTKTEYQTLKKSLKEK